MKSCKLVDNYRGTRTSIQNFFLNFGLRNFRNGISIVETCCKLSSRKVDDQSVIN